MLSKTFTAAAFTALLSTGSALNAYPTCTTTIVPAIACCPPIAGHTSTAYVDCGGCAATTAEGASCRKLCASPTPADPNYTAVVTACSPTASIAAVETAYAEPSKVKVKKPCTTTITKTAAYPCGDCGVQAEETVTVERDCKGCQLRVKTVAEEGVAGICVCPTSVPAATRDVCAKSG